MNTRFLKRRIGSSADGRTNKWRLTCPECKYDHYPTTTMLARRDETCPKCVFWEFVNYNEGGER